VAIEIEVSGEELDRIRKNRRKIEERLKDVKGLERTLRILKYRFLLEQREKLLRKLEEMRVHYEELVEFEEKAKQDREYLMKVRQRLSLENERLRKRLEGKE